MSKLPNGWIEMIAEEYCDRVSDGTHDSPKKREQGKLLITSKNIKNGSLEKSSAYNISIEDYIEVNKRSNVDKWDILLSMIGTVGEVCIIKEEPDFAIKNVGLFKCSNKTDSYWLYYYLRSKFGKNYILSRLSGTTQKYITLGDLRKFPIFSPKNFEEQKAIVDVLSSLDEKIELLQEENKTLEELAQTMFKEWFVNFNYHGATGEMEDSELGEIPKGWRVIELRKIVDTINGYAYKGKELVEESLEALVTLKSFNRNGGFQTRGFKPFSGNPKQKQEVQLSDLIVSHTDLTQDAEVIGNPAFIFENGGFKKMYITMDLVKVVSKEEKIDNSFLYYLMKRREFKEHCVGYSNGTTVLHLSKLAIPEYKLGLPQDFDLIETFSSIIKPSIEKIMNNINQVQTLSETRDLLLPKLMSGEIRVEGFGE